MEVLVLDGKNYVKASKAARDLGYATDYVGQLCRSGQVDAHLIGRTWYVNQEMLSTHKVEKKRTSRVKAREYAKKSIEEHRLKVSEEKNNYKNIDIRYESDSRELIPKTKKLSIKSTPAVDPKVARETEEDVGENEIVNEGDKVLMSGDLTVVDVTDGPVDLDTVVLTPGRIKRSRKIDIPRKREDGYFNEVIDPALKDESIITPEILPEEAHDSVIPIHTDENVENDDNEANSEVEEGDKDTETVKLPTFMERLERMNQAEAPSVQSSTTDTAAVGEPTEVVQEVGVAESEAVPILNPVPKVAKIPQKAPIFPYMLFVTLVLVLSLVSIGFSLKLEYVSDNPDTIEKSFIFSASEAWYLTKDLIEEIYTSIGL